MGTPIDAKTARDIAQEEVENHEAICAERYSTLRAGMADLKAGQERLQSQLTGVAFKVGLIVFGLMSTVIGWLAVELFKTKFK